MKEKMIKGLGWSFFAAAALGSCYLNGAASMPQKETTHKSHLVDDPIFIQPAFN